MSQQNAQTPRSFIEAVEKKFGVRFVFDLACTTRDCIITQSNENKVRTGFHFDLGVDALQEDWSLIPYKDGEAAWLNPPWRNIKPWAAKCQKGTDQIITEGDPTEPTTCVDIVVPGVPIFSLFPAGVGSEWFAKYVLGHCAVYCISPRITYLDPETGLPFVSKKTGKPQTGLNDTLLCDWTGVPGVYTWKWMEKQRRTRSKKVLTADTGCVK